eukprot:3542225-Pyramimonas_sp.AAC.1
MMCKHYIGCIATASKKSASPQCIAISMSYRRLYGLICRDVDVYGNITRLADSGMGMDSWISNDTLVKECMETNFSKNSMWHQPIIGLAPTDCPQPNLQLYECCSVSFVTYFNNLRAHDKWTDFLRLQSKL